MSDEPNQQTNLGSPEHNPAGCAAGGVLGAGSALGASVAASAIFRRHNVSGAEMPARPAPSSGQVAMRKAHADFLDIMQTRYVGRRNLDDSLLLEIGIAAAEVMRQALPLGQAPLPDSLFRFEAHPALPWEIIAASPLAMVLAYAAELDLPIPLVGENCHWAEMEGDESSRELIYDEPFPDVSWISFGVREIRRKYSHSRTVDPRGRLKVQKDKYACGTNLRRQVSGKTYKVILTPTEHSIRMFGSAAPAYMIQEVVITDVSKGLGTSLAGSPMDPSAAVMDPKKPTPDPSNWLISAEELENEDLFAKVV